MYANSRADQTLPLPRLSRRHMLTHGSVGFGAMAFSALAAHTSSAKHVTLPEGAALRDVHHAPRAKNVIFCFMSGGVSHIDSFDPKPLLRELHGKPMPVVVERTQFNDNGNIMGSPFDFAPAGASGIPISSMLPHLHSVADELTVVRSMTTPVNEHAQGNFFMHTGFAFMGYPSAGAWIAYGLGSENQDLPGYVVLQAGHAVPPHGGVSLFSNGFLPAHVQGSILKADQAEAIRNIRPSDPAPWQRRRLDTIHQLDGHFLADTGNNPQVEAAIRNSETAFRMQAAVPELCDISGESRATLDDYGVNAPNPELAAYARQCLLARRLVERGVRFVELSCLTQSIGAGGPANPWDQHGDLQKGHAAMGQQIDQPITALIRDLRNRGLLKETIVIWAGEFGRTPFSQGSNGRDHNPYGFSVWFAGGGFRAGTVYGATDEFGYHAIENKCSVYDMWATVLHQLGINHERLTYRYSGRDVRLTDVHGVVLNDIVS